jgi:uncharacterized membrane protein YdfJ with MMPL/SSD domain
MAPLSIGRLAANHPWLTFAAWSVVLVASVFMATRMNLTDDDETTAPTESESAYELLNERFRSGIQRQDPEPETLVNANAGSRHANFVIIEGEPDTLAAFLPAADEALRDPNVGIYRTISALNDRPELISVDGGAALIQVFGFSSSVSPIVDALNEADGIRATVVSEDIVNEEFEELAEDTLLRGELIGVSVAMVILLLVFGAAVAAGLPVLLAIVAITAAMGATSVVSQFFGLSTFVVNMITMIGLAVGIDYSLLVVQRFREERARGHSKQESIERTASTSGRAVLFSGIAVVIALSGMFMMPDTIFRSFATGTILVVVMAVVAALTLLPAMLSLLGDKVNLGTIPIIGRQRPTHEERGMWNAITHLVMRNAIVSVVVAAGLLLLAAGWVLSINLGSNGIDALPESSDSRHAFEVLNTEFTESPNEAIIVIGADDVTSEEVTAGIDGLLALLAADESFGAPELRLSVNDEVARLDVSMKGDFSSRASKDAVSRLRDEYIPDAFPGDVAEVFVGGDAAEDVDFVNLIRSYIPRVFIFVLALSFILLLVAFRSIVVPIKAVVMNLLSVGAAYGLLVLVFQEGVGADLLGFQTTDIIEPWLPLFLFSILFGLSMDYHVFLLSRIKERFDQTGDNQASVAFGLRSTGSLITGAALIMVAVFGGFAMGDLVMFQQVGFGLASAVIIDATIVRSVLVPASMALLGRWNWYFPSWLEWLPEVHIEGESTLPPTAGRSEQPTGGGR